MENVTVKLGGVCLPIRQPRSYATIADLAEAVAEGRNWARIAAAALALCWDQEAVIRDITQRQVEGELGEGEAIALRRQFLAPQTTLEQADYSVLKYGGEVYQELRDRGFDGRELQSVGFQVWRFINGLPPEESEEERKAAEIGADPPIQSLAEEVEEMENFTEDEEASTESET